MRSKPVQRIDRARWNDSSEESGKDIIECRALLEHVAKDHVSDD